jgi:HEAT repeat protein
LTWLVVGLLMVVGWAIVLDPAHRVPGWVNGEPFYQGRAASAWRLDLRDRDEAAAAGAFNALVEGRGESVPVSVWVLRNAPEPEARWRAADALGKIGKDATPAGPALVAALSDGDPLVRRVAARSLGELAPDVADAVPALVALFPDIEAIRAVARFGPHAAPAVRPLLDHFANPDPAIRWQAARAVGKIGPPAVSAVPELARLLRSDPDPLVREHAAEALGDIGPPAADGIPALAKALRDPVARVRRDAVRALGQMGPAARGVLTEVRAAADDPDPDVKAAATRAARLIDPATLPR